MLSPPPQAGRLLPEPPPRRLCLTPDRASAGNRVGSSSFRSSSFDTAGSRARSASAPVLPRRSPDLPRRSTRPSSSICLRAGPSSSRWIRIKLEEHRILFLVMPDRARCLDLYRICTRHAGSGSSSKLAPHRRHARSSSTPWFAPDLHSTRFAASD